MLYSLDEESRKLFKVKADFDSRMDRTPESMLQYAGFIANCQREEKLLPFDKIGCGCHHRIQLPVCRPSGQTVRKVQHHYGPREESHYWAKKAESTVVTDKHVKKALDEKILRVNRVEERMREMTLRIRLLLTQQVQK